MLCDNGDLINTDDGAAPSFRLQHVYPGSHRQREVLVSNSELAVEQTRCSQSFPEKPALHSHMALYGYEWLGVALNGFEWLCTSSNVFERL